MGFDAKWGVLGSIDVELPTKRDRLWIVASSNSNRLERNWENRKASKRLGKQKLQSSKKTSDVLCEFLQRVDAYGIRGMPYGVANRVDRLKAIGNGQVPIVAAVAFKSLLKDIYAEEN
jgi:DNA (cytosine-5)-methyltransferase 1